MIRVVATSLAWVVRTLIAGSWPARIALLGLIAVVLAVGGSALGPVTMQTLAVVLVLFFMIIVIGLLAGGGRR